MLLASNSTTTGKLRTLIVAPPPSKLFIMRRHQSKSTNPSCNGAMRWGHFKNGTKKILCALGQAFVPDSASYNTAMASEGLCAPEHIIPRPIRDPRPTLCSIKKKNSAPALLGSSTATTISQAPTAQLHTAHFASPTSIPYAHSSSKLSRPVGPDRPKRKLEDEQDYLHVVAEPVERLSKRFRVRTALAISTILGFEQATTADRMQTSDRSPPRAEIQSGADGFLNSNLSDTDQPGVPSLEHESLKSKRSSTTVQSIGSTHNNQGCSTGLPSGYHKEISEAPSASPTGTRRQLGHSLTEDDCSMLNNGDQGAIATTYTKGEGLVGVGDQDKQEGLDQAREDDGSTATTVNSDDSHIEDDKSSETSIDELEGFQGVLEALNFEQLSTTLIEIRRRVLRKQATSDIEFELIDDIDCTIRKEPADNGSYNLILKVLFSDGLRWIVRVPRNGHTFQAEERDKMKSDYETMIYIATHTTIPLPSIHHLELDRSRVGTVFAVMDYISGKPLITVWESLSEFKRLRILSQLAESMAQLLRLGPFDKIGTLLFDTSGNTRGVGPMSQQSFEGEQIHTKAIGPFNTFTEYLGTDWDISEHVTKRGLVSNYQVVMALRSIPQHILGSGFYLAMADFDSQNIMVDEDEGTVTGIIDWDNVATQSISRGCGRYPSWITRDWDPTMYGYRAEDDEGDSELERYREDSPEKLSRYRQHYSEAFARFAKDEPGYDPIFTRLSHIVEAIDLALHNEMTVSGIAGRLLDHAFDGQFPITRPEYADLYEDDLSGEMDEAIQKAFAKMWRTEWEPYQREWWHYCIADHDFYVKHWLPSRKKLPLIDQESVDGETDDEEEDIKSVATSTRPCKCDSDQSSSVADCNCR